MRIPSLPPRHGRCQAARLSPAPPNTDGSHSPLQLGLPAALDASSLLAERGLPPGRRPRARPRPRNTERSSLEGIPSFYSHPHPPPPPRGNTAEPNKHDQNLFWPIIALNRLVQIGPIKNCRDSDPVGPIYKAHKSIFNQASNPLGPVVSAQIPRARPNYTSSPLIQIGLITV